MTRNSLSACPLRFSFFTLLVSCAPLFVDGAEATGEELCDIDPTQITAFWKDLEDLSEKPDFVSLLKKDAEVRDETIKKPAVLIIGPESAGKSTLINYLLGARYKKKKKKIVEERDSSDSDFDDVVDVDVDLDNFEQIAKLSGEDLERMAPRNHRSVSFDSISMPSIYTTDSNPYSYVEVPLGGGFHYNKRLIYELLLHLFLSQKVSDIKAIFFVFPANYIYDRSDSHMWDAWLRYIDHLFENITLYAPNCFFIFSKNDKSQQISKRKCIESKMMSEKEVKGISREERIIHLYNELLLSDASEEMGKILSTRFKDDTLKERIDQRLGSIKNHVPLNAVASPAHRLFCVIMSNGALFPLSLQRRLGVQSKEDEAGSPKKSITHRSLGAHSDRLRKSSQKERLATKIRDLHAEITFCRKQLEDVKNAIADQESGAYTPVPVAAPIRLCARLFDDSSIIKYDEGISFSPSHSRIRITICKNGLPLFDELYTYADLSFGPTHQCKINEGRITIEEKLQTNASQGKYMWVVRLVGGDRDQSFLHWMMTLFVGFGTLSASVIAIILVKKGNASQEEEEELVDKEEEEEEEEIVADELFYRLDPPSDHTEEKGNFKEIGAAICLSLLVGLGCHYSLQNKYDADIRAEFFVRNDQEYSRILDELVQLKKGQMKLESRITNREEQLEELQAEQDELISVADGDDLDESKESELDDLLVEDRTTTDQQLRFIATLSATFDEEQQAKIPLAASCRELLSQETSAPIDRKAPDLFHQSLPPIEEGEETSSSELVDSEADDLP